mgnify:CR=1 FL=1|tara:strand:+ start:158 stop:379 length:222 start_codon:yes stop_codon:yes gene_type:complete
MNKLQIKMAELKSEISKVNKDPQKIIDICCGIFGITGKGGGSYEGVKHFVGGQMRLAQQMKETAETKRERVKQ